MKWTTFAANGTRTRRMLLGDGWVSIYVMTSAGHSFDYSECADCGAVDGYRSTPTVVTKEWEGAAWRLLPEAVEHRPSCPRAVMDKLIP